MNSKKSEILSQNNLLEQHKKNTIIEIKKLSYHSLKTNFKLIMSFFKNPRKQQIITAFNLIKNEVKTFLMLPTNRVLARMKLYQKKNYESLKSKFMGFYNNLRKYDIDKYTTSSWNEYNNKIEISFLPFPSFSFLNDPVIRSTMFVSSKVKWIKEELKFIESSFSEGKLRKFLVEDYIGMPELSNLRYSTSNTTIHHLYSICKFLHITKCDLNDVSTIVEWGGGYGDMAKILLRMTNKKITYIIIDTPLFSCIQWLYLASIYGSHSINLIQNSNDKIELLKINLLPVCFIESHEVRANLFISTWALSESSKDSQEFVAKSKWFNSKYILLAYQESNPAFPDAGRIELLAKNSDLNIERIHHKPGNSYAMK